MDSSPRNTPHIFINSFKNEINDKFIDFFIKEVILPCHGGQIWVHQRQHLKKIKQNMKLKICGTANFEKFITQE